MRGKSADSPSRDMGPADRYLTFHVLQSHYDSISNLLSTLGMSMWMLSSRGHLSSV